jgi:hypothetical protein
MTAGLAALKHDDVLDIFSPLKRKESEIEIAGERKEKRLKESMTNLAKSTRDVNKRFSTVINADGKKEKSTNHSTKRDDIRIKEREMEKESMKALTQKGSSHNFILDNSRIPTRKNCPSSSDVDKG